ncbi:protein furry homolog-like isoform X2 [Antedon mediterranea]|uniref:protein furry homolog-like isoform X2 n=1 Tax=Antedon mediterranea TaxID=105859 RepID=UPI003AF4622D
MSTKSDKTGSTISLATSTSSDTLSLPWILERDHLESFPSTVSISIDTNVKPGQYVLQSLFAEFTIQAERKIEKVMGESLESPLAKSLQRREDPQFDQLLSSLSAVAEHCLPSLLKTLFEWYDLQNEDDTSGQKQKTKNQTKGEKDFLSERRDLAVDFLFCLVLIEVLKQLPVHPVPDEMVLHIETLAFKHFKHREVLQAGPNAENFHIIADLYAEVLGVVAQTRYMSIRKRFLSELKELRSEPQNVQTTQSIISLIMGMKFYRVKMVTMDDFEASCKLLHDCANYFLDVKDKDIKHALAGLLVEILIPVAACVKHEVNIPVLKSFVEKLYQTVLDQCGKKKHSLAYFPLVTCLLCVSQKQFFLSNWHFFLTICLSNLKHQKEAKMSRVALESLYRLLWVYMIRIKCESNNTTHMRLQSIVNSLFPKGSRNIVPRDTPLFIFVKIIQFIAQEKLDFAVRDVIFDLVGVVPKWKVICPERMNIGLRAFLVIADSRQQNDGTPPMPAATSVMPSGNTLRVKKTFLSKQLTEEAAKSIGMIAYYPVVCKALNSILQMLNREVGRPLLMTNVQCVSKESDDVMTGERKLKIELFRTCVAAIPRLIPEGLTRTALLEMLSWLTVHRDEELRGLAFTALQNMMMDLLEWREEVLHCFVQFVLTEVLDTFPLILENSLKMLVQLLTQWKLSEQGKEEKTPRAPYERNPFANTLNMIEGFSLVFLCSCRPITRRLAVVLLKEVRLLFGILGYSRVDDDAVIDTIDRACPLIVEGFLNQLPPAERAAIIATPSIDLHWLVERSITTWSGSSYETTPNDTLNKALASHGMGGFNPWIMCLANFFASDYLPHFCPTAVYNAWPFVYYRLSKLYAHIDPSAPSDSRISIRSKKTITMMDGNLALWRNYLVMACSCAPPSTGYQTPRRCLSPEPTGYSPPDNSSPPDRQDLRMATLIGNNSASTLFNKFLVPHLRCENTDIREAVVNGLGWTNAYAFRDLMDELQPLIRDAIERKQENMRRRRRRDFLRVHLIRVLELLAEHGVFKESFGRGMNKDAQSLNTIFVEYIDGMRMFLEGEGDKDSPTLQEIRLHFSGFIHKLIRSMPVENRANLLRKEAKYSIFFLCGSWCRKLGLSYGAVDRNPVYKDEQLSHLEMESLKAMSSLLVCGEVFDPNALYQQGYLYSWLDNLLNCPDERVHQLGKETAILLLENNPKLSMLLTWTIDRCYTSTKQVADGCFQAMAAVLNSREMYPCDLIPTLCVILLKAADASFTTRNTALNLLQVLHMRFYSSMDELLQATYGKSHILLSQELAKLHPELTLAIFSELTERFDSAPLNIRQNILEVLLPWLYNIELVESCHGHSTNRAANKEKDADWDEENECPLKGVGWGSERATNIVLNNLFFITSEYGEEHTQELRQLWAGLCKCWPGNLRIILDYLLMLSGIATNPDLLPYVKMVLSFIAGAKSQTLIEELMREMLSWDAINTHVERIDVPPYFRLFNSGKLSNADQEIGSMVSLMDKMDKDEEASEGGGMEKSVMDRNSDGMMFSGAFKSIPKVPSDPGTRERTDSIAAKSDSTLRHSSCSSLGTLASGNSNQSSDSGDRNSKLISSIVEEREEDKSLSSVQQSSTSKAFFSQWCAVFKARDYTPLPLPTPDDLYCAPLCEDIDDNEPPHNSALHRCNLAVVLMADLVTERLDIDWAIHLPNILHVVFLGLDHSRPLVHEHSKRLLLNLLIVLSTHNDYVFIAQTLLTHCTMGEMSTLVDHMPQAKEYDFTGCGSPTSTHPAESFMPDVVEASLMGSTTTLGGQSTSSTGSSGTVIAASPMRAIHKNMDYLRGVDESSKALIEFLVTRKCRPMWCSEVITPRVVSIKSAEQIEVFLRHVLKIFKCSLKTTHLEQRWSQVALQLALGCPIRHYAGRSFQMLRALCPPLNARMMSDILRRLVDTVADQAEENQGYVTEILLTLEAMIEPLANEIMLPEIRDRSKSGTNYSSRKSSDLRKSTGNLLGSGTYDSGKRHASNLAGKITENATQVTNGKTELRGYSEHRTRTSSTSEGSSRRLFTRSISTTSIKSMGEQGSMEDKLNLLVQLFWISVSLLESDYEYEFSLALKLIDKLLKHLPPDRPEIRSKMESVLGRLKWQNFPGLQSLLLKGFTSASTSEATLHLIAKLTVYCHLLVVDPTQAAGFPMNVIAVLPYLIQHFEQPDKFAMEIANNISRMCSERYTHMSPLSTVLTMYSEKTYNRDSKAWTGVVCKYVHNNYSQFSISMMTFLIEVLEKGPMSNQLAVLTIVYSLIHNVDLMSAPMQQVNDDLLRVIAKYVQGPHWKESLNILKLAVSRSSSLVKPSTAQDESRRRSRANTDGGSRKDLPGRTMEFTFDLSKMVEREDKSTPVIRRKFTSMMTVMTTHSDESAASTLSSDDSSLSTEPTEVSQLSSIGGSSGVSATPASANQSMVMSAWRKPQHSQRRTKDKLVKVLQTLGQNVGVSRSPSIIFSSTSDIALERQPSTCSSETTSLADNINNDNKLNESDETFVFKDFDFLDVELEGNDEKAFNWCVSRQSLESLDTIEPSAPPNLEAVIDREMKDSSDEDETNSNSGFEDNTSEPLLTPMYDSLPTRSHMSPSQSYSSIASELEALDTISSTTHSTYIYIPVDEVEEVWRAHVLAVMNDTTGQVAVNTFLTFTQLYKVMCQRFCYMTREVCNYLGDQLRDVASQFLSSLDLLRCKDDCPYVYIDTETLLSTSLLDRHKYYVLWLQDNYNTYVDKRDSTVQSLDAVKTSLKMQTMSSQGPEGRSPKSQQVDLCRKLYKLHFQLLTLYDSYCKLVTNVSTAKNVTKITDCSSEVSSVRMELIQMLGDIENEHSIPLPNMDPSQMTPEVAVTRLENFLATKQFKIAIIQLHYFRSLWASNVFGASEEDDLDVLLALCSNQYNKQKTGVLVITTSNNSLSDSRNRLTDANMQLRAALTLAESLETSDTENVMEPPIIVEEAASDVILSPKAVTSPSQERLTPIKEIVVTEGEKRPEEKEVDTSKGSLDQSTESEVEELDLSVKDASPLSQKGGNELSQRDASELSQKDSSELSEEVERPKDEDADVMEEKSIIVEDSTKEAIVMKIDGDDREAVDVNEGQEQAKCSNIEKDDSSQGDWKESEVEGTPVDAATYQDDAKRMELFTSPERLVQKKKKASNVKRHSSPEVLEQTPLDSLIARIESGLIESKVDPDSDEDIPAADENVQEKETNINTEEEVSERLNKPQEEDDKLEFDELSVSEASEASATLEADPSPGDLDDSTKTDSEEEKLDGSGVWERQGDSEPSSPTIHSTNL